MKPGDKVWVFQSGAQEIREEAALNVTEYSSGAVWISTMSECGILGRDVFPTREALCEHYRKIFE